MKSRNTKYDLSNKELSCFLVKLLFSWKVPKEFTSSEKWHHEKYSLISLEWILCCDKHIVSSSLLEDTVFCLNGLEHTFLKNQVFTDCFHCKWYIWFTFFIAEEYFSKRTSTNYTKDLEIFNSNISFSFRFLFLLRWWRRLFFSFSLLLFRLLDFI